MHAPRLVCTRRGDTVTIHSDWYASSRRLTLAAQRAVSSACLTQGATSASVGECSVRVRVPSDCVEPIRTRLQAILAAPGAWRQTAVRKRFPHELIETRGNVQAEPFDYEQLLPEGVECDEPMNESLTDIGTSGSDACEVSNPRLLLQHHVPNLSATKPNREMLHHV